MSAKKLFAYLSYSDAEAIIEWMTAIGFEVVRRQDGPNRTVLHSEMKLGSAVLMVASYDADYQRPPLVGQSTGGGLYLLVEDVTSIYQKALAAGAKGVIAPEKTAWGSDRARVLDPQGGEWSFGTYEPGSTW